MPSEMDSWARVIKSFQEVPGEFKKVLAPFEAGQSQFPYTVYAPPDKWGLRKKTNAKLIVIFDHKILFAEKVKNEVITREYEFANVTYIERGSLLLYSWLKIAATVNNNIITVVIEFNTVVEPLFEHIIEIMRVSINNIPVTKDDELYDAEKQRFDYLMKIDYKYMNFSKASIIPGERVCNIVYQPVVSKKYFKFFSRIIIFPHILILTDTELIIIQDEESQSSTRYGGIRIYIPLGRISDLKLEVDTEANYDILTISFTGNDNLRFKFSSSATTGLESFMREFHKAHEQN